MLGVLRHSAVLDGYRGGPAASRPILCDIIERVGVLVDDFPEVAELDLNPVICRATAALVVDARIRLSPAASRADTWVRHLP